MSREIRKWLREVHGFEAFEARSQGSRRFPEHGPLRAFLSLASIRAGKPAAALIELVDDLLAHHDMGPYAESLKRQLGKLRGK